MNAPPTLSVVASSQIEMVGYDAESQTLFVVFKGGSMYAYSGVPESVHRGLMTAKSLGSYFGERIKGKDRSNPLYPYEKIGSTRAAFEDWWNRRNAQPDPVDAFLGSVIDPQADAVTGGRAE